MSRSKKSRKPGTNSNDQLVVVRTRRIRIGKPPA